MAEVSSNCATTPPLLHLPPPVITVEPPPPLVQNLLYTAKTAPKVLNA
jgi:hypothetical protein